MTHQTPLRAVKKGETPPKPPAKSLKEAADRGERELLVSMRDEISDAIAAKPPAHTLAPLMRQMREIDKEIRALDIRNEEQARNETTGPADNRFDASAI